MAIDSSTSMHLLGVMPSDIKIEFLRRGDTPRIVITNVGTYRLALSPEGHTVADALAVMEAIGERIVALAQEARHTLDGAGHHDPLLALLTEVK